VLLNEDYIVSKFYQYAGYVKYNRLAKTYYGGCPTCHEGSSWGKKRRLYYVVKKNLVFCHNCGLSMRPVKWIQTVSGLTYTEIIKENQVLDITPHVEVAHVEPTKQKAPDNTLPEDAINLSDKQQIEFYKDNYFVCEALKLLQKRKLDIAVNRPKTFWISLTDKIHKNRLVIPFYDAANKIVHYQTRTVVENKKYKLPKYLSKSGSEKTLFGINAVDERGRYLFITEGPLDACFIKNGIAVAGINEGRGDIFTSKQQEQLGQFSTLEQIWVLDNQHTDKASYNKTKFLIKNGCTVFIWPKELKKFKDLNELCINQNIGCVPEKFIIRHSYSGLKAKILLSNNLSQSHQK